MNYAFWFIVRSIASELLCPSWLGQGSQHPKKVICLECQIRRLSSFGIEGTLLNMQWINAELSSLASRLRGNVIPLLSVSQLPIFLTDEGR